MNWIQLLAVAGLTCSLPVTLWADDGQSTALAEASVCLHVSMRTSHRWVDDRTIQQEVTRIWQSKCVTIPYPDRRSACGQPTSRTVLLLLVNRPQEVANPAIVSVPPAAMGATVKVNEVPTNLIAAFAERAVAASLQVPRCSAAPSRCVSLFLGRIVAHELGHVLLRTTAHMQDGLMRPSFNEHDFEDEPGDRYLLTAVEREMVLSRLTGITPRTADARAAPAR